MRLAEQLKKLNEIDAPVPVKNKNAVMVSDNLNAKLLKKIEIIAGALAQAFAQEGIDLDANLVAEDIKRDCGLMGDIISTDELDVENNPFDAATKQMHDMGPVDTNMACQTLLNVPPHEFVAVFMDGLRRDRGLLPGGMQRRALPNRPAMRALPNRGPRRIGESKEDRHAYILDLVSRFSQQKEELEEEILTEKITDLKAYFNSERNKKRFKDVGLDENRLMKIVALDPTYKEGSNKAGDYLEWLLRMVTTETMTFQEMMDIGREWTDALHTYNDYKQRNKLPADKRDIMRFKTFDELFTFLQSLGSDIVIDAEEGTTFKDAIKNIRGALINICGFKDDEIPQEIKTTEDALTFCGETSKWELYKINSIWGAMLADTYGIDWGAGATWCTGGQYSYIGEPRKGMELYNSANQHYEHYTRSHDLYFFSQKDNSVTRPYNKIQLQLGEDGYTVSNVFHANDQPLSFNAETGELEYSRGWGGNTNSADVLSVFLTKEGLVDMVKGTSLGGCESIKDAETSEKLARGEPYIYSGERAIKSQFKPAIKKIIFSNDYSRKIKIKKNGVDIEVVGIPDYAFRGCSNLEEVEIPVSIEAVGYNAFAGCDKVKIMFPRYPDRPFCCYPQNTQFIMDHLVYIENK